MRFIGPQGTLLEIGVPLNYNSPELKRPLPVTFFGFLAPFPRGTEKVEIWNRRDARLLAVREVSPSAPEIVMTSPINGQLLSTSKAWDITWKSGDRDSKVLETSVLVSANGRDWSPLAYRLAGARHQVAAGAVPPGRYYLKLAVNDESHVRETSSIRITILPGERP